jgi:hypothetical protein
VTSVWFVTPAFGRYELSAVCFDQRRLVMNALEAAGIEARQVVIADDENLDLARERGFDTVERDNEWLGRRFNDGTEYAAKHGADWIIPIGSDSWIDPAYLVPLPHASRTRTSRLYAVVEANRMATLRVGAPGGRTTAGPYMFNRRQLVDSAFRPAGDTLNKNIDSSTVAGAGFVRWVERDLHPLQYVGFRGHPHITKYERLQRRWGVAEYHDHWKRLIRIYPADLVARARAAIA